MSNMPKSGSEIEFSRAKAGLSEVMTEVVHRHHAKVIDRNSGRERALLIGEELAEDALAGYRFAPEIIADEGEVTARLAEFGLLGFGETVDEAMSDLVHELDGYADRFLADYGFYRRTKRAHHLPYLLRFKVTAPERRLDLLLEDSKAQIALAR
jgi:Antitoxin of toxin-antitoxin, RelE / RelB, TA system